MWVTLVGLLAIPSSSLAQDVTGVWDVRWAQAVRINRDGSVEIQRWGDAELALTRDGTAVSGTWTTHVAETVTWTVAGTVEGDRILLEATENDSDNPELEIVERLVWRGTIAPNAIEGTVEMSFKGMDRVPGARPFTATRRPAGAGGAFQDRGCG